MPGILQSDAGKLSFCSNDGYQRYDILSPVQLDRRGQLVVTLAMSNGQGDGYLHQDEVNLSVAKGRSAFAQGCAGLDAAVVATEFLELGGAFRTAITHRGTSEPPRRS